MTPPVKRWLRRAAALLGVAGLVALLWAGLYVYGHGFTRRWRTQLADELRSHGLDFSASRLTLNPFEGLVAENVHLYLLDEHHTQLMSINRAAVDIDFLKLIQKKPFLNSLDLHDARLWVPVDLGYSQGTGGRGGRKPVKVRLRRFQAKLIFLPGEVQISQAEGEVHGIQISVTGSLLHPESFRSGTAGPAPSQEELERQHQLAKTILTEIEKIRSDSVPPRVEVRFSGDLARLDDLRAEMQLRGDGIRRGAYRLSTLRAQLNYEHGSLRVPELQMADARGKLSASGDFNPVAGQASFQLDSGLDLPALAREFLPEAESLLGPVTLHDTPHLRIDNGQVQFASARLIAPNLPAVQLTGRLSLGRCAYRKVEFERAETDFSWSSDRWYLRGLHVSRPGNSAQQITADVLAEPGGCRVRLNSTYDPGAFAALLPTRGRAALGEWKFQDAPRVELTATGKSLDDPDGFRVEGRLTLGRTRYRGVGLNRGQSEFAYGDRALSYRHFTLERDEGSGAGDLFVYDFGRHEARLENVRATLDPGQISVWIDPDVAHAVAPYHFRKPPATVTNGVVQFDGGRNSRLTVEVNAPGGMEYTFLRRPLVFQSVVGQVLFTDDRLRLNDMRGEIFGGQMRGSLDLSLVRGAPDYTAALEVQNLDFPRLTKLFFDYDAAKGQLGGSYRFTGRGDDARTLRGSGQLRVDGGNVLGIPFLGPLSGILGRALPNFGVDVAHEASASFQTKDGKVYTGNINARGTGFSLFGAGWLGYVNDTMNMRVRINSRGLPGAVLYPVSKLLEYGSQGPLERPIWKPRIFKPEVPIGFTSVLPPALAPAKQP